MSVPRFDEDGLWRQVCSLHETGRRFHSVKAGNEYFVDAINEADKTYSVHYESGRSKVIPLRDLYAVYSELYNLGAIPRDYLKNHRRYSHAPGATLFAILPALDDQVQIDEKGGIHVTAR